MKFHFLKLLMLSVVVFCWTGHVARAGQDDECRLDVRLFPAQQILAGHARLTVPAEHTGSTYLLRLAPEAEISSVEIDQQQAEFDFSGDRLSIELPNAVTGRTPELTIRYRARFADPLPENTVGMENPSFGVAATIGDMGAYLSAGTAWFPQPQVQPGSYSIRIEGPQGFYGVTSGKLLKHGSADGLSFTEWQTRAADYGLALSAGYYRIFQQQSAGIQVLAFLSEQNVSLAQAYLDPTEKYLQFYQRLLGPYPYEKFAIVENFLPTGYGLPSWTLLGSNVIALPFIPHTSLPHEIVHSWFGNDVEVDYQSGNWAEGLTSYLSDYLLKEQRSEQQGREYRLKLLRDYAALVSPELDYPLTRFVSRASKPDQAIGYGKAAMIFHMLRRDLGEERFWSAVRRVAAEGSGQRFGWSDLQRIFSAEAGRDLQTFFQQWVERKGALKLQFADVAVLERGGGWEVRGMIKQATPLYEFNLPLHLQTEAGTIDVSVAINGEDTPVAIRSDALPLQLSGDPDAHLFRHMVADELPATINDLRASRRLLVIASAADDPLLKSSADLMRGLQKRNARVVSWKDFDPTLATEFDLLFIGWPPQGVFDLQGELSLEATVNGFSWQEIHYQDKNDSLFHCRKNPRNPQRLIAVFHPLSAVAAQKVARKISHYGRYSLLVFKDGANMVKKTNEAGASPLNVKLNSRQNISAQGRATPQLSSQ